MVCSAMVNCDSLTQFWGGIAKAHIKAFLSNKYLWRTVKVMGLCLPAEGEDLYYGGQGRAGACQGIEGGAYCESFGAAVPLGASP